MRSRPGRKAPRIEVVVASRVVSSKRGLHLEERMSGRQRAWRRQRRARPVKMKALHLAEAVFRGFFREQIALLHVLQERRDSILGGARQLAPLVVDRGRAR